MVRNLSPRTVSGFWLRSRCRGDGSDAEDLFSYERLAWRSEFHRTTAALSS